MDNLILKIKRIGSRYKLNMGPAEWGILVLFVFHDCDESIGLIETEKCKPDDDGGIS